MELKEALKKYGYAGVITMLFLGAIFIEGEIYECKGNDPPLRDCIKLSSTNRSCYHKLGRDLCSDGVWTKVKAPIPNKIRTERCTPQECNPVS